MSDTLRWEIPDEVFEDGTKPTDWLKIESSSWQWQDDTREVAFDIYEHAGQYWKLYRSRWVEPGASQHSYGYGGQACRVALVEYPMRARSPHSNRLQEPGDLEWVRVHELDPRIHRVVKAEAGYESILPERSDTDPSS